MSEFLGLWIAGRGLTAKRRLLGWCSCPLFWLCGYMGTCICQITDLNTRNGYSLSNVHSTSIMLIKQICRHRPTVSKWLFSNLPLSLPWENAQACLLSWRLHSSCASVLAACWGAGDIALPHAAENGTWSRFQVTLAFISRETKALLRRVALYCVAVTSDHQVAENIQLSSAC